MRALVAGGHGMIGTNVLRILHYSGASASAKGLENGFDFRKASDCDAAVQGCDRVFHLADRTVGIGYSSKHHGQMMTDSLLISLNLLEAARKAGVKDYLYVSSSCADDPGMEMVPVAPDTSFGFPEVSNQGYGWAKRIGEIQCMYYAREYEIRTVIVRPANIYGPSYDWARPIEDMHVIPALICKMLRGDKEIWVWGRSQKRTFQHEDDAAKLMIALMEHGKWGEAYNLGGLEYSIFKIAGLLVSITGWRGFLSFDESKPTGPMRKAHDTTKLDTLLGCNPNNRPLELGLAQTVEAARKALA